MYYIVDSDRLVGVRGNQDHPYTRGRLCLKVKDFEKHHYNEDRLIYPMRRIGPKGSRQFERISWDDALSEIKDNWTQIIEEYGPQAILPFGYAGTLSLLNGMNAGDAFFNCLGASIGEKTFCASGSVTAQVLTIGPTLGTDPESFVHARFIVLWGANTISTTSHLWPFILEARKRGAKVVVVDPYRTRTAAQADWHIALRPGTDGVLAMGMINIMIEESLIDREYVQQHTLGYEELSERAKAFPPDAVEVITGVDANNIRQFAREYARNQPSVIRLGVAPERHPGGGQGMRVVDCLPALVGAWRHVGGGLLQMPIFVPVRWDFLSRPDWIKPGTRVINLLQIGNALQGMEQGPPIQSMLIWNTNPVSQLPDSNKIIKGLLRKDLFTVVSEHFITDSAAYADILLPASMAAEQTDIVTSWGHFYINYNQKAVDPPGEAVSNFELFRRLARTMELDDPYFHLTVEEMLTQVLDWDAPMLHGHTYEKLKKAGSIRVNVGSPDHYKPHANGNFPTPSGKCEFKSSLAEQGNFVALMLRQMCPTNQNGERLDPLPGLASPDLIETGAGPQTTEWPLQLLSPKSHGFINSEYANVSHKRRIQGEQFVLLNPADAEERGIQNGDHVRVFNQRGEFSAEARVTEDVQARLVVATFGYWRSLNGGSVNTTTPYCEKLGLGCSPGSFHNAVQINKV